MSLRALRNLTTNSKEERLAEAAALTGHVAYTHDGTGTACKCEIETEHDSISGMVLTLEEIVARKNGEGDN